ncbi:unnamed protein product [Soboliphyme baturini]|uniref:Cystatin domain-containing protein n=1 Tax=Soboliphyme baturini TaxID=241478 RepID=A0A183IVC4_9BILA|nr:unnamed protein product [Soboliphyme baturini]
MKLSMTVVLFLAVTVTPSNQENMPGAPLLQDPDGESATAKACLATRKLNSDHSDDNFHALAKVKNFTTQVVNGVYYNLDFYVVETSCIAGEVAGKLVGEEKCATKTPIVMKLCSASIFSKPWDNINNQVQEVKCRKIHQRQHPENWSRVTCKAK